MKMKIAIATAAILLAISSSVVSADARKNVTVNGQAVLFDQNPVVKDGVTLVQFKPIFKELGISVQWNQQKKQITGTKNGKRIVLTVGSKTAYVNGNPIKLDVPAQVVDGSVFVPLRFISESTGSYLGVKGNLIEIRNFSVQGATTKPQPVKPQVPQVNNATDDEITNYLNSYFSTVSYSKQIYDLRYLTVSNTNSFFNVGVYVEDLSQMKALISTGPEYPHKVMGEVANVLHTKYNKDNIGILMHLDFDAPFYPDSFHASAITDNGDGTYHVNVPAISLMYDFNKKTVRVYAINPDNKYNVSLLSEFKL
ncbi:copper amine oxidase N-terminal domain-containing protein [Priestia sp. BR_2]